MRKTAREKRTGIIDELLAQIREPLLRLIRVIRAEPEPGPDFPSQWAQAMRDADDLPRVLNAISQRQYK